MIQFQFADNGNIKPCPYTSECYNFPAGCKGASFWCGRTEYQEHPSNSQEDKP